MASFPFLLHCVLFFLLASSVLASASSISYNALGSHGETGRHLLQQKQSCPVDFSNQNYSIITSQCKGPTYKVEPCCNSFLQIACPYADELNDQKNNCAETLFSYIHLYGKYPPGLFANLCKGDKQGLSCEEVNKQQEQNSDHKSQAAIKIAQSPLLMAIAGFVVLGFNLLF